MVVVVWRACGVGLSVWSVSGYCDVPLISDPGGRESFKYFFRLGCHEGGLRIGFLTES